MKYICFECKTETDAPTWHHYDGYCRQCGKQRNLNTFTNLFFKDSMQQFEKLKTCYKK